jgi:hypothetical protein
MEQIELTCDHCGNKFTVSKRHRENQLKRYKCSFTTCSAKCRTDYWKEKELQKALTDKLSPFKRLFNRMKNHRLYDGVSIEDISVLWQKQQGKCALSALLMELPTHRKDKTPTTPKFASIDRIDSSKPYSKDNIQLVCVSLNLAKNDFSEQQIREFIKELRGN